MSNIDTKDKNIFKRIIAENWESFKKCHPWFDNDHYNEVIQKALVCGSELGGYTEFRCMECGKGVRRVPFTCKSGFSLSCAKVYTDNVVTQISKMLRPGIKYRHVVLMIPEQLRKTFFKSSKDGKLLAEFMKTGQKCLLGSCQQSCKKKSKDWHNSSNTDTWAIRTIQSSSAYYTDKWRDMRRKETMGGNGVYTIYYVVIESKVGLVGVNLYRNSCIFEGCTSLAQFKIRFLKSSLERFYKRAFVSSINSL